MAKWNKLALNIVMVVFGVLMIVGSLLASVGTTLFPFDQLVGTRAAVAGVAFGAGLALAGMQPVVPATWVRAGLVYCVLDILYEIVDQNSYRLPVAFALDDVIVESVAMGAVGWVGLCLGAGVLFGNVPVVKQNFSLVTVGICVMT